MGVPGGGAGSQPVQDPINALQNLTRQGKIHISKIKFLKLHFLTLLKIIKSEV